LNTEQLHAICIELRKEIDSAKLVPNLKQLADALQNTINQPNQPQHQEQVATRRNNLIDALEKIESSERPVTKQQIISEIGGSEILGSALKSRIEDSFTQIDVTPAVVQKDILEMHTELTSFREGIDQLIAGFERLGIGAEELVGYIAELGVLIPRRKNAEDLEYFSKDLQKLNRELMHFNELVTGKADRFKVRSISSSDFSVFLEVLPETAQVIVSTIAILLLGYEKLLDIRKKKAELEKQEAPKPVIDEIDKWAETLMSQKINEITSDLMSQYKDVDRPDLRGNELEGHVRMSVKKIAGRLDVGYHFSARIGNIEEQPDEESDNGEENSDYARKTQVICDIKEKASQIKYRDMEGDSVLPLSWQPDSDEEDIV
jgi:hypothetical protein